MVQQILTPLVAEDALDKSPEVSQFQVAIAGGGIAGLTLACALKNSGLKVIVLEAQTQEETLSKRQVYAISLGSGRIFAQIGVWEQILPRISRFQQIHLSDNDHAGVVKFMPADLDSEDLGYVAEHPAIAQVLQDYLTPAQILYETAVNAVEYAPDRVQLQVQTPRGERTITTQLLVAADGSRSPIRAAAGIDTQGWKYWQSCITTRVKPENPDYIAYEKFQTSGPFAILPLPNGFCNVVWTAPHAETKELLALSDEEFLVELTKRFGQQLGKLELVGTRAVFPVQLMQSNSYIAPRLALIGDAAHCCHPVGGQGLNMGIRDGAALAEVIQKAAVNQEDLGSLGVLQRYNRWRRLENFVILGFTDLLDRFFSYQFLPLVFLRRLGLFALRHIPPLKSFALRLMTGLLGRSPNLQKVSNKPTSKKL